MGDALTKWVIPCSQRLDAMTDMASMGITVRNLFRDLDGAAKSASLSVSLGQSEEE